MSTINPSEFWQSGAFLRGSDGSVTLWQGQWEAASEKSTSFSRASERIGRQDFFAAEPSFLKGNSPCWQLSAADFAQFVVGFAEGSEWHREDWLRPRLETFADQFEAIQKRIQAGQLEKAVPMATATHPRSPTRGDLARWILRLLKAPRELNVYGFWQGDQGVLGATPEVLFRRQGRHVTTMALAGTLLKSPELSAAHVLEFLADPKEAWEHELVRRDIVAQLEKLGQVRSDQRFALELPTLYNICTPIALELDAGLGLDQDAVLLRSLHPTPALGVAPRQAGLDWLRQFPAQAERGSFGAPLLFSGQAAKDEAICLVLIRSLFWDQRGTRLPAGCGQVGASRLEREWNELQRKIDSVMTLLGWI